MKRVLIGLFALFMGFGLATHSIDAEAKRMGGGKSFGMQRSAPSQQNAAPTPTRQPVGSPTQTTPQKRSWMGPIAGLAAGLGLAALMSHLGLGEEMANFLMLALLALVAFLAIRWVLRRNAPAQAPMHYAGGPRDANVTPFPAPSSATQFDAVANSSAPAAAESFPPGFDAAGFAREAKVNFIRLQAAYDAANLDDIRAFTSPEIYAEIQMQLSERSGPVEATDVMALDARVLEAVDEDTRHVVSVHFTGQIREDGGAATALDEVWHLAKPVNGTGGWVIVGIQQM